MRRHPRQGQGQARQDHARSLADDDAVIVEGVNLVKRHIKPTPKHAAGRHPRERSADPRLEGHADRPEDGQAHARPIGQGRRTATKVRVAKSGAGAVLDVKTKNEASSRRLAMAEYVAASARRSTTKEVVAGADEAVRLQEPDAGAAPAEDRRQHGPRRGRAEPEDHRRRGRRADARSPARSRSSPAPRSRSRPSSCARACRSASMVTLRRERMWEFVDRLVTLALPRVRDFRGVSPQGLRRRAATTRSASRSRSSSPRSTTTRST